MSRDAEWLRRMADLEANGCISAGGWVVTVELTEENQRLQQRVEELEAFIEQACFNNGVDAEAARRLLSPKEQP